MMRIFNFKKSIRGAFYMTLCVLKRENLYIRNEKKKKIAIFLKIMPWYAKGMHVVYFFTI